MISLMRGLVRRGRIVYEMPEHAANWLRRRSYNRFLSEFVGKPSKPFEGTVLVDGTWDNPNYWLRYSLLRKGLGLNNGKEVGFTGKYRVREQKSTFSDLGIKEVFDFTDFNAVEADSRKMAREFKQKFKSPDDIMAVTLPSGLPASTFYDYLLKTQRSAFVDVNDPTLEDEITYFLNCWKQANRLFDRHQPKLVIMTHTVGWYAAMVWAALVRGIEVIVPYGDFGQCWFWRLRKPEDLFDLQDRPRFEEFKLLSESKKEVFSRLGTHYLEKRLLGKTDYLGANMAYARRQEKVTKEDICRHFGWDPSKKIVAVYGSNWFDFPHTFGMQNFRDFYDWIETTLAEAEKNTSVNWLFKAHPCDDFYKGKTLADFIDFNRFKHIGLCEKSWNGYSLIRSLDAIISYHGTIGVEATSYGKPVMVADVGWYHDWPFVLWSQTREQYVQNLRTNWWEGMNLDANSRLSKIFAGWYFGSTKNQGEFLLLDDIKQWALYTGNPELIRRYPQEVKNEIEAISRWYQSGWAHYHTYRMFSEEV